MAGAKKVRARGRIRAELPTVAHWCTDDRRVSEWQARMASNAGGPIEWRELRDAGTQTYQGEWGSRSGDHHQYTFVRPAAPPVSTDDRSFELRRSITNVVTSSKGRQGTSEATLVIRLTALDAKTTEFVYEQTWHSIANPGVRRLPFLIATKLRRGMKNYINQCAADLRGSGRRL